LRQRLPEAGAPAAGAPAAAPTGEALPPALRRLLDAYHTLKPGTQAAMTVPPKGPYPYWLLLLAAVGYDDAIEIAKCGLVETDMADPALRDHHFGEVLRIVVDYYDDDDLLKDRIDEIRAEWDEDENELTDDEAQALAEIGEQHAKGIMLVGPKWRRQHGIDEAMVDSLVRKRKLRRGPHQSVQRVNDGTADGAADEAGDKEAEEAEEEAVEQRENAIRIVDLARLNPEWTPLGLARKLHLDERTVRAALQDAGIRPIHQGKGWGGTSRTSLAAMSRELMREPRQTPSAGAEDSPAAEPAEQPEPADAPDLSQSAQSVLAALRATPDGLTAAQLNANLGVYLVTLDALVAQGRLVVRDGGRYVLAPGRSAG
jgi:hypothetical protein